MNLDGLLDVVFLGGAGNDLLDFHIRGNGAALTTSDGTAFLRGLRLRLEGGTGSDTLRAELINNGAATFAYDFLLRGGPGLDKISLILTNPGGPTFGPSDSILTQKGPRLHHGRGCERSFDSAPSLHSPLTLTRRAALRSG